MLVAKGSGLKSNKVTLYKCTFKGTRRTPRVSAGAIVHMKDCRFDGRDGGGGRTNSGIKSYGDAIVFVEDSIFNGVKDPMSHGGRRRDGGKLYIRNVEVKGKTKWKKEYFQSTEKVDGWDEKEFKKLIPYTLPSSPSSS